MHGSNTGRDTRPARVCSTCLAYPCICRMAETTFNFAIRNEACAMCGGRIITGGSVANVAAAIRAHQATVRHQAAREAIEGEASHGNDETGS